MKTPSAAEATKPNLQRQEAKDDGGDTVGDKGDDAEFPAPSGTLESQRQIISDATWRRTTARAIDGDDGDDASLLQPRGYDNNGKSHRRR